MASYDVYLCLNCASARISLAISWPSADLEPFRKKRKEHLRCRVNSCMYIPRIGGPDSGSGPTLCTSLDLLTFRCLSCARGHWPEIAGVSEIEEGRDWVETARFGTLRDAKPAILCLLVCSAVCRGLCSSMVSSCNASAVKESI